MTATTPSNFYADFKGLSSLKTAAGAHDPKALRDAARQFESLFTQMLLKSMRQASFGDSLTQSKETEFYRDMFDQQLSVDMSKGHGIGLAEMLIKQLTQAGANPAAGGATNPAAAASGVTPSAKGAMPLAKGTISSLLDAATSATDEGGFPIDVARLLRAPTLPRNVPVGVVDGAATMAPGIAPSPTPGDLGSSSTWPPTSREDFIRQMWPHAQAAAQQLGVHPATLIAHAALETGWGQSVPAGGNGQPSYNLFGIKAGGQWNGAAVASRTVEFENGVASPRYEQFRAYASPGDSFSDYTSLLRDSPRYAGVKGTGSDVGAFAAALQRGGYATDPQYAAKLGVLARQVARGLAHQMGNVQPPAQPFKVSDARPLTVGGGAG
jgi:flagellar protein FlgJ